MLEFKDIQEAALALPDLQFDYRQLQAGQLTAAVAWQGIDDLHITRVQVDRLCQGQGQVLSDRVVFLLCDSSPRSHLFDRRSISAGDVLLTFGGRQSDSILRAGFGATLYNFPREWIGRLPGDISLRDASVVALPQATRAALRRLEREALLAGTAHHHRYAEALARRLCQSFCHTPADDTPSGLRARVLLAGAVRDHLEAGDDVTLGDVCHALSFSERTLRGVFTEVFGVSPAHYQLATRLNKVREELKQRPPSHGAISEVATRHGFWHMGRFSSQYRRLFGETPRETLLQRAGRSLQAR